MVEKPLATSVADAEAIVAAANSRSLTLMVGHTFEYNAAVRKLRQIIKSGELGRILYVDTARLNLGRYQNDCNVIWDLATHEKLDKLVAVKLLHAHCGENEVMRGRFEREARALASLDHPNIVHAHDVDRDV